MANKKTGFIYYTVDTDRYQDKRIKRLKKEMKGNGVAIYDFILSEIYRDMGCFIEWDDNTAFDVAEYWDMKETTVNEIVNYCCHVGLFNKELLASERILSSKSILLRCIEMSKKAKRSDFEIPEKLKILLEERPILPEESPANSGSLPQSKVKDSKGEESKEKKSTAPKALDDDFIKNLIQEKFSVEFLTTWSRWKDYKLKEFKFKFKGQESEKASITELFNLSGGKEITAGAIIQQSMANGWKGLFELKTNSETSSQAKGSAPIMQDGSQKLKLELNYLYSMFLEEKCTIITIEVIHYDFLKSQNLVSWPAEKVTEIRTISINHLQEKNKEVTEPNTIHFMKKFGVIEFFKELQRQGKETVFHELDRKTA